MTPIEFGWRLPAFPVEETSSSQFKEHIETHLRLIQGQFDSVWVADHFIPWARWVDDEVDTLECLSTICYYAGAYPELQFGSIVLCQSYRNPALLAKMGATLQWISGGRFLFGIGAGWKQDEYQAYGYDYPRAAVRIAQLEETVQIVKKMWTEERVTFAGKHYEVREAICEPKPTPRPPILIGGGGEQLTLRVVARHADWWNIPGGTVDNYAHKLDVLRRHCDEVDRDYAEIRKTWARDGIAVAATEEEARAIAAASPFGTEGALVGTPEQVADGLRAFLDLGVTYFMLRFDDFPSPDGALLFAEEVVPLLRQT